MSEYSPQLATLQQFPLERSTALSAMFYRDSHWLDIEQKHVFSRSWQLITHADELKNPGDHVVDEIAHKPIIIVRNANRKLHAFYNVCRHRAGPLATCNGKAAKALHCKYHGWTYTLDGQLSFAPEMQSTCDFDPNTISLPMIQVHEWEGLVFAALSHDVPAFNNVYGDICAHIAPYDLKQLKFNKRVVYDIACNWKVYIDNFLEGYHLPHVHPGLSKVLDYRSYETKLFPWYSLQHSPLRNNEDLYDNGDAFYFFVYPNIMLNILPGRLQTNRIIPNGLNRCVVEFDYYYRDDTIVQSRITNEQNFADEIQVEDMRICEQVQKGLMSDSYDCGRLCAKREAGVWHFQNLLRKVYAQSANNKIL